MRATIDPELIEQALKVGGESTKAATVTQALQEFIARRRQKAMLDLAGKLDFCRDSPARKRGNKSSIDLPRFIEVAELRNDCRKRGIRSGTIDALIAQLCIHHDLTLLTTDGDFAHVAKCSALRLWRQ